MEIIVVQAVEEAMVVSRSLATRRHRPNQAEMRSTTHRPREPRKRFALSHGCPLTICAGIAGRSPDRSGFVRGRV